MFGQVTHLIGRSKKLHLLAKYKKNTINIQIIYSTTLPALTMVETCYTIFHFWKTWLYYVLFKIKIPSISPNSLIG